MASQMIGDRILYFRKRVGLTRQNFADKLSIHYQTVFNWEKNVSVPETRSIKDVAKVLEIEPGDLWIHIPAKEYRKVVPDTTPTQGE